MVYEPVKHQVKGYLQYKSGKATTTNIVDTQTLVLICGNIILCNGVCMNTNKLHNSFMSELRRLNDYHDITRLKDSRCCQLNANSYVSAIAMTP